MSMLDTIANEMIMTNLTQMTLRVAAGLLGKEHLRVAVLGESTMPGFAFEVLQGPGNPSCSLQRFDHAPGAYVSAYYQLDPAEFDCFIAMGRSPQEEAQIREILSQVPMGAHNGKLLIEWPRYPGAVLGILGRLQSLPSCLNYQKLFAIAAAVYFTDDNSAIFECGVFKGGTTVFMGLLLNALGKTNPIYALDTFCGLPAPGSEDTSTGYHYPAGFFNETSLSGVTELYRSFGLSDRITAVPGLVGDTLPQVMSQAGSFGFAFIDVDQYRGIYDAVHGLLSRHRSIFALIDDTSIPGVDLALVDACDGLDVHRSRIGFNLDVLSFGRSGAPRMFGASLGAQSVPLS